VGCEGGKEERESRYEGALGVRTSNNLVCDNGFWGIAEGNTSGKRESSSAHGSERALN